MFFHLGEKEPKLLNFQNFTGVKFVSTIPIRPQVCVVMDQHIGIVKHL